MKSFWHSTTEMIEARSKEWFLKKINARLKKLGDKVIEVKYQRNLYYSLSGSTRKPKEIHKETSHLKEGYVAFIRYRVFHGG